MEKYNEKKVEQASAFDFWKEAASHSRISRDVAYVPTSG